MPQSVAGTGPLVPRSLILAAADPARSVLDRLRSSPDGLSDDEAARRLADHGENVLRSHARESTAAIVLRACRNPLVVLLAVLSSGSFAAGDMVPADVRLLTSKDLFVTEAILTGESFPVEKSADADPNAVDQTALRSICHLGTSVESGTAEAVVVENGRGTCLGGIAASLELPEQPTAFDIGLERFSWLMVGFAGVMSSVVFLVNGFARGDWWGALFFSLAVAVGLALQILPMIVGVCLSHGAIAMSRKRVIVCHLEAIQNRGDGSPLCRQDRNTHARSHHPREALRRQASRGSGGAGNGLAERPFSDRPAKPARPRDPGARAVARARPASRHGEDRRNSLRLLATGDVGRGPSPRRTTSAHLQGGGRGGVSPMLVVRGRWHGLRHRRGLGRDARPGVRETRPRGLSRARRGVPGRPGEAGLLEG